MPKFTFICEHEDMFREVESTVRHEFNAENIEDILGDFDNFLRGCGYRFDGEVNLVEYEYDTNDTTMASSHSFTSSNGDTITLTVPAYGINIKE